jgi:hypothetical protein
LAPAGSKLVLNRDIQIPPLSLKIYVQAGQLTYSPNQYYPYCRFSVREVKPHAQRVQADEFQITRSWQVRDLFATLSTVPMLAAIFSGGGQDGKPSPITFGTEMDLRSADQPDVFRLMCGHLQDPNLTARYLTVAQVREALGDVFTLRIPGEAQGLSE